MDAARAPEPLPVLSSRSPLLVISAACPAAHPRHFASYPSRYCDRLNVYAYGSPSAARALLVNALDDQSTLAPSTRDRKSASVLRMPGGSAGHEDVVGTWSDGDSEQGATYQDTDPVSSSPTSVPLCPLPTFFVGLASSLVRRLHSSRSPAASSLERAVAGSHV